MIISKDLQNKLIKNGYKGEIKLDILNDICVKYAKEFFGEEDVSFENIDLREEEILFDVTGSLEYLMFRGTLYQFYPLVILNLLQQNKQQEAEDYIKKHTLFNKK